MFSGKLLAIISAIEENAKSSYINEISIRKIEIQNAQGTRPTKTLQEIEVEAKIFPGSGTFSELSWRVSTSHGKKIEVQSEVDSTA